MEVFSYHAGLNKVVEIGNSGVFRPEMLRPMGLPEDVVVIAWGLSLERWVALGRCARGFRSAVLFHLVSRGMSSQACPCATFFLLLPCLPGQP